MLLRRVASKTVLRLKHGAWQPQLRSKKQLVVVRIAAVQQTKTASRKASADDVQEGLAPRSTKRCAPACPLPAPACAVSSPDPAYRQHVPDGPDQATHTVTQSRSKSGRGSDRAPRHPKGYWLDDAVLLRELVPYLKPVGRAKLQALGGRVAIPGPGRGSAPPSPALAPDMSKPERAQFRLPVLAELRRQGNYALINAIARRGGLTAVADHLGFQASRLSHTPGRRKGFQLSKKAKAAISHARTGRPVSEESRLRMSQSKLGKRHTAETRLKMSVTRKHKAATKRAELERERRRHTSADELQDESLLVEESVNEMMYLRRDLAAAVEAFAREHGGKPTLEQAASKSPDLFRKFTRYLTLREFVRTRGL